MSKTVLFVHGAFVGGWIFEDFAKGFRDQGFKTLTPDLMHRMPSGGRPNPKLGHVSLIDYANELSALIRTLPEKPIIVGHSMGGLLAQKLAARNEAEALVLITPSAPWGVFPSSVAEVASAFGLLALAGDPRGKALRPDRKIAEEHAMHRMTPAARKSAIERMVPESGQAVFEVVHWWFDHRHASAVDHHKVKCPVLCVAAQEDVVNTPATVRSIAARYRRQSTYREMPGMGHFIFGEPGEEELGNICIDWVKGLPSQQGKA